MSGYVNNPNIDIIFKVLASVERERFVSVHYLSCKLGYSIPTIKNAGRALFSIGVLETKKGTGGGYRSLRSLEDIQLSEFLPLIAHEKSILQCVVEEAGHLSAKHIIRKIK